VSDQPPEWARLTDDEIARGRAHVARLRAEAAARAAAGRDAPHPRHTPSVDPVDEQF
jgi:hypothetical protein